MGGAPGSPAERLWHEGVALARAGRHREAADAFGRAAGAAKSPDARAKASKRQGIELHASGSHAEAIAPLRLAAHTLGQDTAIHSTLALCLRELGRTREAIDACERCLAIDPAMTAAIAMGVELLVRAGRDDRASELIAGADRRGLADARVDLARGVLALRRGDRPDAIERLRRHAAAPAHPPMLAGMLRFTLGDLLDAEGRHGEAWAQYELGNTGPPDAFDPDAHARRTDAIIDAWTPELVESLRAWGDASERPVLIVGMPRSGTTLVESLLTGNRGVVRGGELMALAHAVRAIEGRHRMALHELAPALDERDVCGAAGDYLRALGGIDADADRVTDKMPMNFRHLGLAAAALPNARIVHCTRHPLDTCLSCYTRFFHTQHPWTRRLDWLAAYYRDYERLMDHWVGVLGSVGGPAVLGVPYERAVRDPEGWGRRLAAFVGVPGEPRAGDGAAAPTLRADQVGRAVYTTSVGRHARYSAHLGALTSALSASIERHRSEAEE